MEINELKAGDWVLFHLVPVKIIEVHNTVGELTVADASTVFSTPVSEVEPIPLTEDILKKNSFMPHSTWEEDYWEDKYHLRLEVVNDESFSIFCFLFGQKKVEFVHEFQHILWALGFDDDLKV